MAIAVESLFLLLAGLLLAAVLWYALGRPRSGAPVVRLIRSPRAPDGRERTFLTVNDRVILIADNEGLRSGEYADQLEQLEAVAARIAAALGVSVELTRTGAPAFDEQADASMDGLPAVADDDISQVEARLRSARDDSAR
jgi:hypothetical protein